MSLKTKTVLTVLAFFVAVAFGFFAVFYVVTKRVVAELERDAVRQNMERALGALEREIGTLDDIARDWAGWDDTYAFVEDRNEECVKKNLANSTFEVLRINYVVFLNRRGQAVYARGYDPDGGRDIPVPAGLVESVLEDGALAWQGEETVVRGWSGCQKGWCWWPQGQFAKAMAASQAGGF